MYEEGETTLEQEQALNEYFSSGDYDEEFEAYAVLFRFLQRDTEIISKQEIKPNKRLGTSIWLNVAATICIVLGGFWFYESYTQQKEIEKAKFAFETTQDALNLLSINMNQGLEKLEYVEVFSEQKNQLFKTQL